MVASRPQSRAPAAKCRSAQSIAQLVVARCRLVAHRLAKGLFLVAKALGRRVAALGVVDEVTLVERFGSARRIALTLFPPQGEVAGSYQAFMKLLSRWTAAFRALLTQALRGRMRRELPGCWQVLDFVMFGVDGSSRRASAYTLQRTSLCASPSQAEAAELGNGRAGPGSKRPIRRNSG